MKNKLEKYDYMVFFVIIMSIIFFVQQYLFREETQEQNQKLRVEIIAPIDDDIENKSLDSIKELYFSNSLDTSEVIDIEKSKDNEVEVTLMGEGLYSEEVTMFEGQHIAINQRVKIHGLLELEGYITNILLVE